MEWGLCAFAMKFNDLFHTYRTLTKLPFEGIGHIILQNVPRDWAEYEVWLDHARTQCAKTEQTISSVTGDALLDPLSWKRSSEIVEKALFPCEEPPRRTEDISWVFIIDLDRLVFTVDYFAHFDLFNTPRGLLEGEEESWSDYMWLDGRGVRCLDPNTPREFLPFLEPLLIETSVLPELQFTPLENLDHFESASSLQAHQELTVQMAKGYITSFYQVFSEARYYIPTTSEFQNRAAFLLSIIAPGFTTIPPECLEDTGKARDDTPRPDLGIFYWFRNCLIMMTNSLDDGDDQLRKRIFSVVEHMRRQNANNCTAIIWSIQHAAVVVIEDNSVKSSPVLPVVGAFRIDELRLEASLRTLAFYLSPTYSKPTKLVPGKFHGGTLKSRLTHLPMDVILHIIGFMDSESYYRMGKTCWEMRKEYIRRPIVGPYRISSRKSGEGHVLCSVENSEPLKLLFMYEMEEDRSGNVPLDARSDWTNVVAKFPSFEDSRFSCEWFEDYDLNFFLGLEK